MKNSILLQEVTVEDLKVLLRESVKSELEGYKKTLGMQKEDTLLSREEAAKMLKIHETTLWHWTNKGKVTAYSIVGKRYYKREEILQALVKVKS